MEKIETLELDLETYSEADLKKTGVYPYAEHPSFEILLFGYSVNGGEVKVVDVANGEKVSEEILKALTDNNVIKWAHNCSFERICLSAWLRRYYPQYFVGYGTDEDSVGEYLDPASWHCSMIWGAYMGLPLSLKGVGEVLGLSEQKLSEGEELVRYFCKPCSPTKSNGGRTRNLPCHAPEKWEMFKAYNKRDVEAELGIMKRLSKFPVPDFVWEEYRLNEEINDRGIAIDRDLVKNAIEIDALTKEKLTEKMKELTGVENPNSVMQFLDWLSEKGVSTDCLDKKAVRTLLKDVPEDVAEVLTLRQQASKTSVRKYEAMQNAMCADGRIRGMFMFYGANRTGRFAGRLVMLQNLPQCHMPDLDDARGLVRRGEVGKLTERYENIPNVLSELIRTALVPKKGYKFVVADFSAIEARVLAWLAGEKWVLDTFAQGGDIYCATASKMYHCNVVKNGENGHLRQKGKQATLSCIAEGQLVLTNHGEKPIETVTTYDLVWDGESWVKHDGVIYKGEREVITYEGLTATPDHLVWIEGQSGPVQFGIAAACGAHLIQTGNGRNPIRLGENNIAGETIEAKAPPYNRRTARLYDIRNAGRHHRFTVSNCLVHNCGYGGGKGALIAMGALESGMKEEELQPLVDAWRAANPNIVRFWHNVEAAAKECVRKRKQTEVNGIKFTWQGNMMFIEPPSGRRLAYARPRIEINRFLSESVTYEGLNAAKHWERIETFGGKLVENIVQAVARDILCYAMRTLSHCFIVGHVHDEVIIEADERMSLDAVCRQMARVPPWAEGLILRADGFEAGYYQK